MKRNVRGITFYLVILAVLVAVLAMSYNGSEQKTYSYSQIVDLFENEQVKEFVLDDTVLTMTLQDGSTIVKELPDRDLFFRDLGDLVKEQYAAGIITDYDYPPLPQVSWIVSMLPYIVMIVIFILLWMYMLNQSGAGGGKMMSFGRAKVKTAADSKKKVTFRDVAGAEEEKEELKEVVDFLKGPRKYTELGARIPKGLLLVGPPGTGKTLFAKAVAGEAGVPFFSISGSDFVEMFVGVGASRVRDLFDQAKKSSPCIVFIDEIDAVGRHRGAGLGGGHDEREQTLNQLLVEMDGFGVNEGVIIIAATNRPDILDPALLRPGRFDRQIFVSPPDVRGREEILQVHGRGKPLAPDVSFKTIAKTTVGFTGADLENLLNEAALLAARRNKKVISMKEIEESTLKVIVGPEKHTRVFTEKERKLTAYHEGGHALATYLLPGQDPVHQISIIPRGRAGGFTLSLPAEDKNYATRKEMLDELVVLLGGRVAESLALDDISTGASNDLDRASQLARQMITKYGMSGAIGPVTFGSGNDEVFLGRDFTTHRNYSEDVASQIDREVRSMLEDAYARCEELLKTNMDRLHKVARYLFELEKLSGEEFALIMSGNELPAADEVPVQHDSEATQTPEAAGAPDASDSAEETQKSAQDGKNEPPSEQ